MLGSLPKAEQPRGGCEVKGIICQIFTILLFRWEGPGEEGVVCGCLDHLPEQEKIGPQVLTPIQYFSRSFAISHVRDSPAVGTRGVVRNTSASSAGERQ